MRRRPTLEELNPRLVPAVLYVSPSGNDANAGTDAAPWRTLQRAADVVNPGDQVVVRAGTYAGFNLTRDGTAAAPIAFTADAGVTINSPNPTGPHAGKDGINLEGADHVVIDGFKVVGMTRAGIRSVVNTGAVLRDNTCDDNGTWGIFTGFSEDVTIEHNVCSNSHTQHGIYVSNSADNPVVRWNVCFGNYACGIHMNSDASQGGDGVITGALIEGNVIHDNGRGGGSGINMDGVSDSVVRNNVLYNNHATGIALYMIDGLHGARNNVVANNTVRVASDGRWALLIVNGSTGARVFNNVLLNDGSYRGSISVSTDSLTGLVSDYNVVMDRFTTNDGDTRLTLAQWQQTGRDAHSLIATPAQLFADPVNGDYRLSATSPAVDRGTGSLSGASAPSTDFEGTGRPSGGGFDIGADELDQGPAPKPTANADEYSVSHDRLLTVPAKGLLANDQGVSGGALSAVRVTAPAHGTLTLNADGSFTYRPAAGYVGDDAFTYLARDGTFTSDPATVTLHVTNQAPVATDDAYQVRTGRTLSVAAPGVLKNDTDADGDARTAVLEAGPAHGTLKLNANGSFTYTPAAGFVGTDSFTYRATDKLQPSAPATVTIDVLAPPKVKSVVVNDGSAQRSNVRSVTVTFDALVTLDTGAIYLVRGDGTYPTVTPQTTQANGETTVVLTFRGAGTLAGLLTDGNWSLVVRAARVHRLDLPSVVMAAGVTEKFHSLYGDSDGNRTVDASDRSAFQSAVGQTDAASLATFDSDGDGDVDAADQVQFDKRFGRRI